MEWLKWWRGSVTDPKFRWVARKASASLSEVVTVWAALLEHGGQASPRGSIESFDAASHDVLADLPDGHTAAIVAAMRAKGLHDGHAIARWDERQKRDDSRERVNAFRQRQRDVKQSNERNELHDTRNALQAVTGGGVTACNAQEERRGEERRVEHASACEDAHARDPVSIPDRMRDCPPAYQAIVDRAKVLWAGKSDAFPRDLRAAWGWDGKLTAYWDEKKPQAFLDALEDLSAKERPEWTVARYLVFVNTCDRRLRVDAARTTPAAGREVPYKPTRHDGPAVTEADIEAKRRWEQTIKFA
jgi:hypothetical protein